jgi:hypothetical protein
MTRFVFWAKRAGAVALLGLVLLSPPAADGQGTALYQNNTFSLNADYAPAAGTEVGNEVTLGNGGAPADVGSFTLFYGGDAGSVDIRLYSNNGPIVLSDSGPLAAPGSVLYNSGFVELQSAGSGVSSLTVNFPQIQAPGQLTWTATFSATGGSPSSLAAFGPPTIGAAINEIWVHNGGSSWSLLPEAPGLTQLTFGAEILAPVPEPGTVALLTLGFLLPAGRLLARPRRR